MRRVVWAGVIVFIAVLFLSTPFQAQSIDPNTIRVTLRADHQPFGRIVQLLMERYGLSVGFEQSKLDRGHSEYDFHTNLPGKVATQSKVGDGAVVASTTSEQIFKADFHPITIDVRDASLERVMNEIVRQMDNYRWELNQGVVNIVPMKERDSRFEKLLSLNIEKFKIEKGNSVDQITEAILSLPEFRKFVAENNFRVSSVREGFTFVTKAKYGRPLEKTMEFSNLSLRDLLNRITNEKGGGWILKWKRFSNESGKDVIDIDI
jgi:hypothetical protein